MSYRDGTARMRFGDLGVDSMMRSAKHSAFIITLCLTAWIVAGAHGQDPGVVIPKGPNDRLVAPGLSPQDPSPRFNDMGDAKDPPGIPPVWVLHFKFKDPRIVKVKVPGKGERLCWYVWYQVYNFSGEPRQLIPTFEIKADTSDTVHHDQILPAVEAAVARVEDPASTDTIRNSVTISQSLIPVSSTQRLRPVTGVALWDDIETNAQRYTLFVTGLSNGWSIATGNNAGANGEPETIVRRKTLQVEFRRVGNTDRIELFGTPRWVYRGGALTTQVKENVPAAPKKP